ncbi:MAG TPA: N-formylglutamate amidohydrolase [Sneathiellales bacterium]|nr:N-formylglutamate amidohydrolase [Sneathiellales bacterium]
MDYLRGSEAFDLDYVREPFEVDAPITQKSPIIYCSPHSGSDYPDDFLCRTQLDLLTLRRSEDCFVDEIFSSAPTLGSPLLKANFPRAYLDVNREPYELDPAMFCDPLPTYANTTSYRVAGGFGTVARIVAEGLEIYADKLPLAEAERRIETLYMPYHDTLSDLIEETTNRFDCAVLVDCHSMPSNAGRRSRTTGYQRPDIILGDRFGASCAPVVIETVERVLLNQGYSVTRNAPFAGGHTVQRYGQPAKGMHALQIEISRGLYMDEELIERLPALNQLIDHMGELVSALAQIDISDLGPRS